MQFTGLTWPGCGCAACTARYAALRASGQGKPNGAIWQALLNLAKQGKFRSRTIPCFFDSSEKAGMIHPKASDGPWGVYDLMPNAMDHFGIWENSPAHVNPDYYLTADGKSGIIVQHLQAGVPYCIWYAHWQGLNPAKGVGWRAFTTAAVMALTLVVVAAGMIDRVVLARLARVGHAIRRIGRTGDMMTRVPVSGGDELADLGVYMNDMLAAFQRSQDALWSSETRYRALFENANDAIFLIRDDIFMDCNARALAMFGCLREQIIGQPPYLDRFSPTLQPDGRGSREKTLDMINRAQSGTPQQFEWRYTRYDGTPFEADVTLNRLEWSGEVYVQAMMHDITERKRTEELGAKAFDLLKPHAGRPDFIDRTYWVRAIARTGDRRAVAIARGALTDTDGEVVFAAIDALAALGCEGATHTLLAVAGTRDWSLAKTAVDRLVERGDVRVAPRVADRLFREILKSPITDSSLVTRMRQMLEVLVELSFVEPAPRLRKAAEEQPDGGVATSLRSPADRLDHIRENGDDPARWSALLTSQDPSLRALAIRRLAGIGGPAAYVALESRFAAAGPEDREAIVAALGRRPDPAAADLFERVLDDPAFDDVETLPIRAAAAWAARRLGGARMAAALARSAARTEGVDLPTLVSWAQLAGDKALPDLERLRLRRLRIPSGHRGEEQRFLDEIVTDLRAGRPRTKSHRRLAARGGRFCGP